MQDAGMRIEGGNLNISGVSMSPVGVPTTTDVSNAPGMAKHWYARFNGSLGFTTYGLRVPVHGNYTLQRALGWTYNSTLKAYTTQVTIMGKVDMNRYQQTTTSTSSTTTSDSLSLLVSGSLTLLSPTFPGPGFTGDYGWFGDMDISPDPFVYWNQTNLVTGTRRRLAATSTGTVPVKGPVTVVELHDADGGYFDDGSVTVAACTGLACFAPDQAPASPPPDSGGNNKSLWYVVAAVGIPLAIALCALLAIFGLLAWRRRRYLKQKQKAKRSLSDHNERRSRASQEEDDASSQLTATGNSSLAPKKPNPVGTDKQAEMPGSVPALPGAEAAVVAGAGPWMQMVDKGMRRRRPSFLGARFTPGNKDIDSLETLPDSPMKAAEPQGGGWGDEAGEFFSVAPDQSQPLDNDTADDMAHEESVLRSDHQGRSYNMPSRTHAIPSLKPERGWLDNAGALLQTHHALAGSGAVTARDVHPALSPAGSSGMQQSSDPMLSPRHDADLRETDADS
eukprot:jgi/Chrzof1/2294/Cz11g09340.t1